MREHPLILAGGFYDAKDPAYDWVMRTRLGVCLVHEIKVWDWQPAFHREMYQKLYDFGYGDRDCQISNYWDEGFPVQVSGCDAKGIALAKGGKAITVVTDYSGGSECTEKADLAKLGLTAAARLRDLETGAAIATTAPGEVCFPLKKHDFRAIVWE